MGCALCAVCCVLCAVRCALCAVLCYVLYTAYARVFVSKLR